MTRITSIILWTAACGLIAIISAGFLQGVTFFVGSLFDSRMNIHLGPLHIMGFFAVGAFAGLVLAARGRLPGTKVKAE
jgi:hypothetical protein